MYSYMGAFLGLQTAHPHKQATSVSTIGFRIQRPAASSLSHVGDNVNVLRSICRRPLHPVGNVLLVTHCCSKQKLLCFDKDFEWRLTFLPTETFSP